MAEEIIEILGHYIGRTPSLVEHREPFSFEPLDLRGLHFGEEEITAGSIERRMNWVRAEGSRRRPTQFAELLIVLQTPAGILFAAMGEQNSEIRLFAADGQTELPRPGDDPDHPTFSHARYYISGNDSSEINWPYGVQQAAEMSSEEVGLTRAYLSNMFEELYKRETNRKIVGPLSKSKRIGAVL